MSKAMSLKAKIRKEKWYGIAEIDPLLGRFDSFQIHPNIFVDIFRERISRMNGKTLSEHDAADKNAYSGE